MKRKSAKRRRAGRKRKFGQRHTNGSLKSPPERNEVNTSTVFETRCRHLDIKPKKADRREILDPLRGYVLGKLFLTDIVSEAQHNAGWHYEITYRNWARTAGMPRMTPPAGSYGQSVPGRDDVPDDEAKAAQQAYFAVARALCRAPMLAEWEVKRVCLEDVEPKNITTLCLGLDRLVEHYG